MPRWSGKQTNKGIPVTIEEERYTEGDVIPSIEGGVVLGEKPGNVAFPIQIDAAGNLKVTGGGGGGGGTEYSDGDLSVGSLGTLIMGDDGANIQNIAVGSNGRLQVEVVAGEYDGIQYQDGAAAVAPFGTVVLGHDGSNVFPVVVDSSGYLQVDIRNLPADTFSVEGAALGKGVLVQGDDGVDRHNVAVDAAGNVQVDVVGSLPAGDAAIGKLAANDGVDIGDVDVASLPADTFSAEDAALGKGVLIQGNDGTDRHNVAVDVDGHVQVDIVDEPKSSVLNSVADVTMAATSTTQILPALSSRLCALISNKKGNTQTMRIGDSHTGATRGIELAPGNSISVESTEAIYGYNPGGSGENVGVIWTED